MGRSELMIQVDELEWDEHSHGRFGYRRKQLGAAAGGQMLGCSLFEIPPGRRPFPYHWHTANEEAIYVLSGRGTLRLAGDEVEIKAGDYVACPVGPEGAHQLINSSDDPLRVLLVSEMIEPEVVVQPDSDKIGVIAGAPPGGDKAARTMFAFFRKSDGVEFQSEDF